MATQGFEHEVFKDLTWRRVQLLRHFADGQTESFAAREMNTTVNGERARPTT